MKTGLVLGKFLPLHKGHLALFHFAKAQCDFLYIVVCCSSTEQISGSIRKKWIENELQEIQNFSVICFYYDETVLPNTSISSPDVSKKWAEALKRLVPSANCIFTSEPYGDYLSEYMEIPHIAFDEKRKVIPISASMIKKNSIKYWDFIADFAKPWFVKKVVLLGSESTGKSILTKNLAAHFTTTYVPEMAREIIEKTEECSHTDLKNIAILHANEINKLVEKANKLLFIDTDINITKSYSRFLFNQELLTEPWIEEVNMADLYLFLETDCPFVQDGTRLNEEERNRLSLSHKLQLKDSNINFVSIGGNWNARLGTAISIIKKKFFA